MATHRPLLPPQKPVGKLREVGRHEVLNATFIELTMAPNGATCRVISLP
ncbi:MAG TPA: hypothetical protein V6D16_04055 [Candidatus Obscuribacterales bacterium]